jgi:hypothetical protein
MLVSDVIVLKRHCDLLADFSFRTAELPASICVWLASPEARFLKGKLIWSNWDVEELIQRADEIKCSTLLNVNLNGAPM